MDEDFIIEETSPWKIFFSILFIIIFVAAGIWAYYKYIPKNNLKLKPITIEVGSKLSSDINDYASGKNLSDYTLDTKSVHLNKDGNTDSIGEYSYKLINGSTIKKGKINIVDTTKPVVDVQEITVGVNEDFDPSEFVSKCDDLSLPCVTTYDNIEDAKLNAKAGTYNLKVVVSDQAKNKVIKDVKLNVSSTTTLESIKKTDLNVSYSTPKDKEWNNTYTYKFASAIDDESKEYEGKVEELSSKNYSIDGKTIKDRSILVAYNKYNYVVGISVKLMFDDGTILYVTNESEAAE